MKNDSDTCSTDEAIISNRLGHFIPVLAFLFYLLITLALFFPVLSQLNTHVIGRSTDLFQVLWDAWWINQSLFKGENPFFTGLLYHPYGVPLVLHMLVPIQASIIASLNSFLSIELSYNIVVILALPLAGISSYYLCRFITRDQVSSVVGGLVLMLSPAIVSRVGASWMNMLYLGILPLLFFALLKSTDPEDTKDPRKASWLLAITVVLIQFTGVINTVIAANLVLFTFIWQVWDSRKPKETILRFVRALMPAVLVGSPYLIASIYYIVAYDLNLDWGHRTSYLPDVFSYLLPFTPSSAYSNLVMSLDWSDTARIDFQRGDTACYLGLLVAPLGLAGLIYRRQDPVVRLCLVLFVVFFVFSLGPRLMINRIPLSIMGHEVPLPYAAWQYIPLIGGIEQSGRLLVVSYMMLGVGVACIATAIRKQLSSTYGVTLAIVFAGAICVDYAFTPPGMMKLPTVPNLAIKTGSILDPSFRSGTGMFVQMHNPLPLVGGYLSKSAHHLFGKYRKIPGMGCLYFDNSNDPCDQKSVMEGLRLLDVSYVLLPQGDKRNDLLLSYGFELQYPDSFTAIWRVPEIHDKSE